MSNAPIIDEDYHIVKRPAYCGERYVHDYELGTWGLNEPSTFPLLVIEGGAAEPSWEHDEQLLLLASMIEDCIRDEVIEIGRKFHLSVRVEECRFSIDKTPEAEMITTHAVVRVDRALSSDRSSSVSSDRTQGTTPPVSCPEAPFFPSEVHS